MLKVANPLDWQSRMIKHYLYWLIGRASQRYIDADHCALSKTERNYDGIEIHPQAKLVPESQEQNAPHFPWQLLLCFVAATKVTRTKPLWLRWRPGGTWGTDEIAELPGIVCTPPVRMVWGPRRDRSRSTLDKCCWCLSRSSRALQASTSIWRSTQYTQFGDQFGDRNLLHRHPPSQVRAAYVPKSQDFLGIRNSVCDTASCSCKILSLLDVYTLPWISARFPWRTSPGQTSKMLPTLGRGTLEQHFKLKRNARRVGLEEERSCNTLLLRFKLVRNPTTTKLQRHSEEMDQVKNTTATSIGLETYRRFIVKAGPH